MKPPDLPVEPERWPTNNQDRSRNCADMLNMQVDMHGSEDYMNTARDMHKIVSTGPKPPNLPPEATIMLRPAVRAQEPCKHVKYVWESAQQCEQLKNTCRSVSKPGPTCQWCRTAQKYQSGSEANWTRWTCAEHCK